MLVMNRAMNIHRFHKRVFNPNFSETVRMTHVNEVTEIDQISVDNPDAPRIPEE
jgi:hypothetical protein